MTAIIVLSTSALLGMVWVQIILLQKAFALARQAHAQSVNAALSRIVDKLEDRETVSRVFRAIVKPAQQGRRLTVQANIEADSLSWGDSVKAWSQPQPPPVQYDDRSKNFTFTLAAPERVRLRILDSLGRPLHALIDEMKPAGTYHVGLDSAEAPKQELSYDFSLGADSTAPNLVFRGAPAREHHARWLASGGRREQIIEQVLDEFAMIKRPPIEARVQPAVLDSVVRAVLHEQGLTLGFAYGILDHSGARDSLKFATPAPAPAALRTTPFHMRLFPSDPWYPRHDLLLYFPEQDIFLLKKNGWLLASVSVLLAAIAGSFLYTLRTLFKQKQFAHLLTQFINNMTHEFKTPISTIALASEAFKNPAVLHDREKMQRYGGVIWDESQRMRSQVEKILQMAVLEEGDYELNLGPVDVHETLAEAMRNFAVQMEKRKGEMVQHFQATHTLIHADAVHFANMIHNLLDNANKYTPAAPRLVVTTSSDARGVHLRIADNGVGLRAEEKKRVFDKYYRVPTGNVHEVKGFGLGLSYVKLIAEAHGGSVTVESEYQRGSVFHLFMPFTPERGRVAPGVQRANGK